MGTWIVISQGRKLCYFPFNKNKFRRGKKEFPEIHMSLFKAVAINNI